MPGIYGSTQHIVGKPSKVKPAQHAPCVVCKSDCYRQVYTAGQGWQFRHNSCDPNKTWIERRRTRGGAAMGYVPSNYEGGSSFDPALAHAIHQQR